MTRAIFKHGSLAWDQNANDIQNILDIRWLFKVLSVRLWPGFVYKANILSLSQSFAWCWRLKGNEEN